MAGGNFNPAHRGEILAMAGPAYTGDRDATANPDTMTAADTLVGMNFAAPSATTLPPTGVSAIIRVKDRSGAAAANPITVNAPAGETIEGAAFFLINTNSACVSFRKVTTIRWEVIGR